MDNRNLGIFPLSGNFEIKYAGPIDARQILSEKSFLFSIDTWKADGDSVYYIYNGMPVIIWNDPIMSNNGLYILLNKDLFTEESSWLFIGKQKNSIFAEQKSSSIDPGEFGDISITDDYLYICVSTGITGNAIWKKVPLFATL